MHKNHNRSNYIVLLGAILFVLCTSFAAHKFYVGIYQVAYAPAKKRLQISMRLFVDDCNAALYQNYHQKTKLGDKQEVAAEVSLLDTYIKSRFKVQINGKFYALHFKRKELENNVLICYYTCEEVPKPNRVVIDNSMFTTEFPDQQNILQVELYGKKQSALLTQNSSKAEFVDTP